MSTDPSQDNTPWSAGEQAEIWCSVRPHLPAAAFCTVCRRRYAGRYLSIVPDGCAVCFRCISDFGLGTVERLDADRDPVFRRGVFSALFNVLSGNYSSFSVHYRGQIRSAILFGLSCSILGLWAAIGWFLASDGAGEALQRVVDRSEGQLSVDELRRMIPWMVPFAAAVRLFFGAMMIHGMLRIFSTAERGTLRVHTRFYALSCASLLLLALPGMWGAVASNITWTFATISWVRRLYPELSVWRVMIVVLPHILLLGAS